MTETARQGAIAVLDIGKTNVKVALVDAATGREISVRKMPNTVRPAPPYAHFDTEAHWRFLLDALRELGAEHAIAAISITTHGASGVLVAEDGSLALPILDYEDTGPEETAAAYDALRPPFADTGSPRLGIGLNLGAQLHFLFTRFPDAAARTRHILMYPQYWAFRLTGVAASEVTSLGCHTDLWEPGAARLSTLVDRMGWRDLFPPLRKASAVLGPLLPAIAAETGLAADTPVLCGIHDSNASLYPHLLRRSGAFSVVSTGTWVVSMAIGGSAPALDPDRDTLINVSARGEPVFSARFMGGREYEIIREGSEVAPSDADRAAVLAAGLHLLPAVEPGSGPFRGRTARWTAEPATPGQRMAALAWYLALMTATCLEMIGAAGPVVVEGPFAANDDYLRMLASATGRPVEALPGNVTGTSAGAALLAPGSVPPPQETPAPVQPDPALAAHAADWRRQIES